MNPNTLKRMKHFVGKVCSIISTSMNRSFDESISREHFVVRIQEITLDGVWGTHPYNEEMVSFFAMQHIISIHEEMELNPNDPSHAEMIKEYEDKTGQKIKPDVGKLPKTADSSSLLPVITSPVSENRVPDTGDATFIDIMSLEKLAEHSRRTMDAYESWNKS